jgi:hypothetical protein
MKFPPVLPQRRHAGGLSKGNVPERLDAIEKKFRWRLNAREDFAAWSSHPHFAESPVLLDVGQWSIHNNITISKSNIHISGFGYHTVIKAGTTNADGILTISGDNVIIENVRFWKENALDALMLHITGNSVTIRNCWFDGNANTNCILANVADKLTVDSCYFNGGTRDIIYVLDSDESVISNNRVVPPAGFGGIAIHLASTNTAVAADRCNDAIVSNNHVGAHVIRYNNTGLHVIADNNNTATTTGY